MKSSFFMPRASTSASTLKFGEIEGLTPLEAMMSSSVSASTGLGARGSSSCPWTHTTPSTFPLRSISSATLVTMPVHCAPSTARRRRA